MQLQLGGLGPHGLIAAKHGIRVILLHQLAILCDEVAMHRRHVGIQIDQPVAARLFSQQVAPGRTAAIARRGQQPGRLSHGGQDAGDAGIELGIGLAVIVQKDLDIPARRDLLTQMPQQIGRIVLEEGDENGQTNALSGLSCGIGKFPHRIVDHRIHHAAPAGRIRARASRSHCRHPAVSSQRAEIP